MARGDGLTKGADGFGKYPENINRKGRPLKIYTQLKKLGYSKDDVRAAYGELAFYTEAELKEVLEDDGKPAIAKMVARAFLNAIKKGDYKFIRDIMEVVLSGSAKSDTKIQINFMDSA